jgi:hypothetical protein
LAFLAAGAGFSLAQIFFEFIGKVTGLDGLVGSLSAMYVGCLLGVHVAPSGHRKVACFVFAMLPVLVSIGEIVRYAALGTLGHTEGVAMLFFGGMGSAVTFYYFKRINFRTRAQARTHYSVPHSNKRHGRLPQESPVGLTEHLRLRAARSRLRLQARAATVPANPQAALPATALADVGA